MSLYWNHTKANALFNLPTAMDEAKKLQIGSIRPPIGRRPAAVQRRPSPPPFAAVHHRRSSLQQPPKKSPKRLHFWPSARSSLTVVQSLLRPPITAGHHRDHAVSLCRRRSPPATTKKLTCCHPTGRRSGSAPPPLSSLPRAVPGELLAMSPLRHPPPVDSSEEAAINSFSLQLFGRSANLLVRAKVSSFQPPLTPRKHQSQPFSTVDPLVPSPTMPHHLGILP